MEAQVIHDMLRGHHQSPGLVWQGMRDDLSKLLRKIAELCGQVPLMVIEGSWYTAPEHADWQNCACTRCEFYRARVLPLRVKHKPELDGVF